MRFDAPAGLLLLAAVPLAALLLLGRLRRRERTVAAFFLVRDLVDALPLLPRSFLLRRRIQTALFLAALACAGLAAGGPVLGRADDPPQRAVFLLDHLSLRRGSAGRPAGWSAVTAAAAAAAREFRSDDRILVVRSDSGGAGAGLRPPREAAALIEGLSPTAEPSRPDAALDLLDVLERAHKPSLVAIFTATPERWRPLVAGRGVAWRIVSVPGDSGGVNHALLDVEVRPDPLHAGRIAVFCRAGSFGPAGAPPAELELAVRRDGTPLARRTMRLAPGETGSAAFPALDAGPGLLEITLSPADAFPDDDIFLSPLHERIAVPTLLVTEENQPLAAALRALPGLQVTVARPGTGELPTLPDVVVQVYDRVAPRSPAGNLLVIAPPEGIPGIGYRGDAPAPRVVRADRTHFLLQGVVFDTLRLNRLPLYEIPSGMDVLATADGHPLVAAGRTPGGARVALLAFDPRDAGWVYDPSYPILIANLAAWLAETPEGTRSTFRVGDALPEALARSVRRVQGPAGRPTAEPLGGWVNFRFPMPGRWLIAGTGPDTSGEAFVNLLDEGVSAALAAPGATSPTPDRPRPPRPFRIEARAPLLTAAILLLLLEQFVAPPLRAGRLR